MRKDVIICGSGPSLANVNFTDRTLSYWAVGSLHKDLKQNVDLYFCMHDGEIVPDEFKYINQQTYPLNDIRQEFDSDYFTNSISYMIAYAIFSKVGSIELVGVDLLADSEYTFEKSSISYWCGIAKGMGIKVKWDKLNPIFLYGYDGGIMKRLLSSLIQKRDMALKERDATDHKEAKDQWTGFIYAIDLLIREIKG